MWRNDKLATEVTGVFARHLWYLGEEHVALSFFDSDIGTNARRDMVKVLDRSTCNERLRASISNVGPDTRLSDLVTYVSHSLFEILGLKDEFLQKDPSEWENEVSWNTVQ